MPPQSKLELPVEWTRDVLPARQKIKARDGDDLLLAYRLAGANPMFPDQRYTYDEETGACFGTNFVRKGIQNFDLLDAMEEAMGTDSFFLRAQEYAQRRKLPTDLIGNLSDNVRWVITVLLGRDPITGVDVPRSSPTPHTVTEARIKELQLAGESASGLMADMGDRARKAKA